MSIFSYIKSHIPILDVVNEYSTLKKAGMYFKGHCPFHHEKTASFTVSPHKDIFYCFGCHVGGDVISFITKIENCSPLDAAKLLAERHQIDLPKDIRFEHSEKHFEEKQHYYELCKTVAQWAHKQLLKTPSTLKYIKERGFVKESITYFNIGYFPGGIPAIKVFLQAMKQNNFLPQDLLEANIMARGKTVFYSPLEERIIFPIKDALGRFCGFGGRTFKSHDTRPKYYNSRENEYFTKGSLLFGLDLAKKSIQQTETVYLVEGYTDCIAMVQHNYPNTVATLGTACTLAHLKQLARYAHQLFIIYDSDKAGHQALIRLTELCWQVNMELKVIDLPPGEDPASFLTNSGDLVPLIQQAKDIFFFFINTLGTNFVTKSLSQKVQITRSLLQVIQTIKDSLKQDILLQQAAKTFDVPFESLKKELARGNQYSQKPSKTPNQSHSSTDNQVPKLEKKIFCAIMHNMQLFNRGNAQLLIDYLPSPLRNILNQLHNQQKKHAEIELITFFEVLDEQQKQYIIKLLLEEQEIVGEPAFKQLLTQLHKKQWKIIVHNIKIKLTEAKQEGNHEKVTQILQDFLDLQHKIMPSTPKN